MSKNIARTENKMKKNTARILVFVILASYIGVIAPINRQAAAASRLTSITDQLTSVSNSTIAGSTAGDSSNVQKANHTISFTLDASTGLAAGDNIYLEFDSGFFVPTTSPASLDYGDIDLNCGSEEDLSTTASGATWGVATTTSSITITSGTDTVAAGSTCTIEIGTNASGGVEQLVNPATTGLKLITVKLRTSTTVDQDGKTAVYVIDDGSVVVSATVDPILSFEIIGGNAVSFGTLEPNAYHKLAGVNTAYGYIDFATGQPVEDETVTVRSQAYTFKDTQAEADGDASYVLIGATAAQTALNLSRAINNNDASNVRAGVDAANDDMVNIVSAGTGTTGNAYTLAESVANANVVVSGATFTDGSAGGNYKETSVDFGGTDGDVGNSQTGNALKISTNSVGGYTIYVNNSSDGLYNGSTAISAWAAGGQYGWGMYAKAYGTKYADSDTPIAAEWKTSEAEPGNFSSSQETLAQETTGPVAETLIKMEYNVRVDGSQAAGSYQDTLTFVASATY